MFKAQKPKGGSKLNPKVSGAKKFFGKGGKPFKKGAQKVGY